MAGSRAASLGIGALLAPIALLAPAARAESGFQPSYVAGTRDAAGRFMGGTELRVLLADRGRLYAGIGYWMDRPGSEGPQGAAILVLDAPGAAWRVEHVFDDRLRNGRARDFAVSALAAITFATDGTGARLPAPVSLLLASTWDLTGATRVFSRDDSGAWDATVLARDAPAPDFLPQIRAFATHRDRATGIDRVFAGNDPRGVFSGVYDPAPPGRIRWGAAPELDIARISTAGFSGLGGRLRVSSFAECNGVLFAAVGQQIYERIDGTEPRWRLLYTNPRPGHSETGLRGLTAIADPAGNGQVLLAAVEGNRARIVRIDPRDGSETTDLDLGPLLDRAWNTRVGYTIAAYNDMPALHDPRDGDVLLIGLEAYIQAEAPPSPGLLVLDSQHRLEGGGWYLVRHAGGRYDLRQITGLPPEI
ncbi:MAG TPA: hypothetical protein VMU85_16295, partial [Stellaceae bacterium]|nr:hypothetical protein [Stellaceae bacterium]